MEKGLFVYKYCCSLTKQFLENSIQARPLRGGGGKCTRAWVSKGPGVEKIILKYEKNVLNKQRRQKNQIMNGFKGCK